MNNWKWWHIVVLVLELAGFVSLVLCMSTDLNDDLLLPVALGFTCAGNLLSLIMNIRQNRKNKK